jgi:hypothetical protein
VPIEADRSWTLEWQRSSRWQACSLGWAGIAQQTLDLQRSLQTGARGMASRMESSNLTAGTRTVYHPLTGDDLDVDLGGAMLGSHLEMLRWSASVACRGLWT